MGIHRGTKVPLAGLDRDSEEQRKIYMNAIQRVVDSGWFLMGPETENFEEEFSLSLGVKHAVAVANGTSALEIALAAIGVGAGDEVVTVANAGYYASLAARSLGATPLYCDVDPSSLLMSASTLENCLRILDNPPKAIVVTHLYGALALMPEIMVVANREGIPVVEDCAQAIGVECPAGRAGTFGQIATTSFYPTKNLGAFGDAGAVFTNDDDLASNVRSLRQYGWKNKYEITRSNGQNSRMDEIQAAILRIRLPALHRVNERRREIHAQYEKAEIKSAKILNRASSSFNAHLAVLLAENRQKLQAKFEMVGVSTAIHYPVADHLQPLVPKKSNKGNFLEVTEWACEHVLTIPCFPEMSAEEIHAVILVLEKLESS